MPNMNNSLNESFTRRLLNENINNENKEKKINTRNRGGIVAYIDKVLRDGINTTLDFVVPHARKEPLNPMAYVRDVNEWFLPSAQMALDEMEGRESYPKWSYLLASLPIFGKVAKPASKSVSQLIKKGAFPYLENETTKKAAERIKQIEQEQREFNRIHRRVDRFDRYGNIIGDGSYHTSYPVYDIPGTEVSISPSSTSESVYVTYYGPNGKKSTSRYSNHFSNQETKDIVDILNELGMTYSVPEYERKLIGQNVKKSKVNEYPFSGKTYNELLEMPESEREKFKGMLISDESGNKKNWIFNGGTWDLEKDRKFFIKDEYDNLFKEFE